MNYVLRDVESLVNLYISNHYRKVERGAMADAVRKEDFDPLLVTDPPGATYPPHTHPETKLLAFLRGSMEVTVKGERFTCKPGDRVLIPGNTEHSALVGSDGCDFFWSEKLL